MSRRNAGRWPWLVGVLVLFAAPACERNKSASNSADDLDVSSQPRRRLAQPRPTGKVVFRSGAADQAVVLVEVVKTPDAIRQGLMYRRSMPKNQGMLFLMERREVQSFWMRNTLIPLDMIFIESSMRVLGIVENAEPRTETSRSVPGESQYVLEVNGGFSERHGLGPGTVVRFEGVDLKGVEPGDAP